MQRFDLEENILERFKKTHNNIRIGNVRGLNRYTLLARFNQPVAVASTKTVGDMLLFYIKQGVYKPEKLDEAETKVKTLLLLMIDISNYDIEKHQGRNKKIIHKICIELIFHGIDLENKDFQRIFSRIKDEALQTFIEFLGSIDIPSWPQDLDLIIKTIENSYWIFEEAESAERWRDYYNLRKDENALIPFDETKPHEFIYSKLIKTHNIIVKNKSVGNEPGIGKSIFNDHMDLGLHAIIASKDNTSKDIEIEKHFANAYMLHKEDKIAIPLADKIFLLWITKISHENYSSLKIEEVYDLSVSASQGSRYAISFLKKLSNMNYNNEESSLLANSFCVVYNRFANEQQIQSNNELIDAVKMIHGLDGARKNSIEALKILQKIMDENDDQHITRSAPVFMLRAYCYELNKVLFASVLQDPDPEQVAYYVAKIIETRDNISAIFLTSIRHNYLLIIAAESTSSLNHKIALMHSYMKYYSENSISEKQVVMLEVMTSNLRHLPEILNILVDNIKNDCEANARDEVLNYAITQLHSILDEINEKPESFVYTPIKRKTQLLLESLENHFKLHIEVIADTPPAETQYDRYPFIPLSPSAPPEEEEIKPELEGNSSEYVEVLFALYEALIANDTQSINKNINTLRATNRFSDINLIVETKNHYKFSFLHVLVSSPAGLKLLKENDDLCDAINAQGLNSIVTEGPKTGYSVLFLLSETADGRDVLSKANLIEKADKESLNNIKQTAPNQGSSALCHLVLNRQTRGIIVTQKDFHHKITELGLNSVIQDGLYEGISTLFALSMYPAGRTLLQGPLKVMILSHALNAIVKANEIFPDSVGWSAASVLIPSEQGNEMFVRKTPDLFNMLTDESFQTTIPRHLQLREPRPLSVGEWLRLPLNATTHAELKARYVLKNLKNLLFNTQWNDSVERPQPIQDQIKQIQAAEKGEKSYDAALAGIINIGKLAATTQGLFAASKVKTYYQQFVEEKNIYALR